MSQWPPVVVVEDNEHENNPQTEHMPMSTSKVMTGDFGRCFETGTDDYVIKTPDLNCSGSIVKNKLEKYAACHAIPT